jgi:CDGSH-type Zn-finger protein/uncharacterized protein YndB with AHSA1/START domain
MAIFRNGNGNEGEEKKIVVTEDGPYVVHGGIPLVHKIQVVSEYGEPLTWKLGAAVETPEVYELCRCGGSSFPPFCDVTHALIDFDGTETADTRPTAERQVDYPGGTRIVVRRDLSLCMESGFCGNRFTNIEKMVAHTDDPQVRAQVMAMIERCPSGSYVYALEEGEEDVEPDLPQQVAVTTEITDEGPIAGPLWVTGYIPIERADGQPFEVRNRVTLCRCGHSNSKPLCDGRHREVAAERSAAREADEKHLLTFQQRTKTMESTDSKKKQNQVSVRIEAGPERVFAVLADVAAHTDWARGPEEIRALSENPARMGTTFQQVGKLVGKTVVAECQVNLYEENRRFGFAGDKPFPFQVAWELEPGAGGTQVTMNGHLEPNGFFKIAAPMLNSSLESQMKADMLTLKSLLEGEE